MNSAFVWTNLELYGEGEDFDYLDVVQSVLLEIEK